MRSHPEATAAIGYFLPRTSPACDMSHYLPARQNEFLPAQTLVFEMHYTPNGSIQQDTTKVGLVLADVAQIDKEVITMEIGDRDFAIPPGADNYVVTATSRLTREKVTLLSLSPHMHLRGKAFRYELVLPTGEREILLDVPAYDFNWQTRYVLAQPRQVPIGSVIYCRAVYDNSAANMANPDAAKTVCWGDQSWDEMMLGYFDVILPRDDGRKAGTKPVHTGLDIVGKFDVADIDHNGKLDQAEASRNELLKRNYAAIDLNGDGFLQLGEILAAVRAMENRQ